MVRHPRLFPSPVVLAILAAGLGGCYEGPDYDDLRLWHDTPVETPWTAERVQVCSRFRGCDTFGSISGLLSFVGSGAGEAYDQFDGDRIADARQSYEIEKEVFPRRPDPEEDVCTWLDLRATGYRGDVYFTPESLAVQAISYFPRVQSRLVLTDGSGLYAYKRQNDEPNDGISLYESLRDASLVAVDELERQLGSYATVATERGMREERIQWSGTYLDPFEVPGKIEHADFEAGLISVTFDCGRY